MKIIDALEKLKLVQSRSAARRIVSQKSVSVDGRKVVAVDEELPPLKEGTEGRVFIVGKQEFWVHKDATNEELVCKDSSEDC